MKLNQLRQLIKEEISKILKEENELDLNLLQFIKKNKNKIAKELDEDANTLLDIDSDDEGNVNAYLEMMSGFDSGVSFSFEPFNDGNYEAEESGEMEINSTTLYWIMYNI
jgi:hypothetical protein